MSQTIIEKAKRYDEIIEEIKGLLENIREDKREILEEDITSIFPELQENEDERIRKAIISGMAAIKNNQKKKTFADIPIDDCIAWLEKQGGKDKLIRELGEYKVKYTQEVLEKHLKTMNKDDERLRKTTIAFLKDFAKQGYENAVECIDWLEKQSEQKPQGKTALEAINEERVDNQFCVKPVNKTSIAVNNPDAYKIGFADGEAHAKEEQWKPSDEQIKVLLSEVTGWKKGCSKQIVLESLYQDLKKL